MFPTHAAAAALALLLPGVTACHKEVTAEQATVSLKQAFPENTASDSVRVAIAAADSKDFATGVIALETAKAAPGLSPGQLAAMEQAKQAITADLTRRADAGDPVAKAHLAAIERSRSQ